MKNMYSSAYTRLKKLLEYDVEGKDYFQYLFLSIGRKKERALVSCHRWRKNSHIASELEKKVNSFIKATNTEPTWLKFDYVHSIETIDFNVFKNEIENTRRNYFHKGISFDDSFKLAFLPQEINANAFVRPEKGKDHTCLYLSEENINTYLKKYRNYHKIYAHIKYMNKKVFSFMTTSIFDDGETIYDLNGFGNEFGIRKIKSEDLPGEIDLLVRSSSHFLLNEINEDGTYNYGYLSHFDNKIGFYNILRHATSTYALLEAMEYLGELTALNKVKKTIDYIWMKKTLHISEDPNDCYSFVFDDTANVNEIKLGQNAALILAMTKYMKITSSNIYLDACEKLANGLSKMIDQSTGETIHVLNYPNLTIKEANRIIYYDGEAAFALMRLYQLDGNSKWLNIVKTLFSMFIKKNYWQYHDHWLSYCTQELTLVEPKEDYFLFGLKNANHSLDFIYERETTYPTFLELLMACYKMIQNMKEKGFDDLIAAHIDEEKLHRTIERRADYQRTGYFYPEIAMYFKNPDRILGSFFIKHHGYRVRIDDIQHYLSGYVQYRLFYRKKVK